jgi:hypothetical protein
MREDSQAKRAWVERILHFKVPEPVVKVPEPVGPGDGKSVGLTHDELAAMIKDLTMQGSVLPEPYRTDILGKARAVNEILKGGDLEATADEVEALQEALSRAAGEARVEQARAVAMGTVQYRKLQFAWLEAQANANAGLDRFVAAVLADPTVREDELYDQVVDAADTVSTLVPEFGGDLASLLNELDTIRDPEKRQEMNGEAKKLIGDYSAMLEESEGLKALQSLSDDEYQGISFFGELKQALTKLEAAIP